jgi:hypothetical protein
MNASADINDPNHDLVTSTENVEGKALADKLENVLSSGEKVHGIPAIHPEHNRADYEANKTKIDGLAKLENHLELNVSNSISP